jgi:RecJ-like exonuclease
MDAFDLVKRRNDALWDFLTHHDPATRKVAFARAFGEPCTACNGTGNVVGAQHGGMSEALACDVCDGTGAIDREIAVCTTNSGSVARETK